MAFTLSGSVITQLGTDTSLAGLSGIGGVTTQVVGGRTIYRIATNTLVIAGNLTYDARTQGLEMTGATTSPVFQVNSGGVLTINSLINSKPSYEEAIVIRPANDTVVTEFQINTGAIFNLNGGKIVTSGIGQPAFQSYRFNRGATINVTDGWIKSYTNQQRWGENGTGETSNFNVNRLITEVAGFTIFGNFGNLQGLSPLSCTVQIVNTVNFIIKDFSPMDSGSIIDNWNNTNVFVDNAISSNVNLTGGDANSMPTKWTTMRKSVVVQALSPTNIGITGAVIYIRDTNNGARLNVANIPNQLNDNVYIQTTNGSGLTSTFQVYILHGKANTGIVQPVIRDYRTKTTVAGADLFDIHTWAYGYQYKGLPDTALKGIGTLTVPSVMLNDTNITLSETNAVAKLASSFTVNSGTNTITVTANSTLDDLYDAMKAWKTRNVQAQLEYPTISTQPVNAVGTNLTTAMNIVINSGVTLSEGIKFQSFSTTGAVTNNGTISGSYTDSTGTRVTIRTADNAEVSSYVVVDGTPLGWVNLSTARNIFVQPSSVVNIYAHAYGKQPVLVTVTGNTASDYVLSFVPEVHVDITQTDRDTIASAFAIGVDGSSRIFLSVNTDLRDYTPAQVLHALHWFVLNNGTIIGAAAIQAGDLNGFGLIQGGFSIRTAGFYAKVADSVTTVSDLGILIPLAIYVDPNVYTVMPTYTPVVKNTSGIVLQYAPWTQQQADVNTAQISGSVWSYPTREITQSFALESTAQEIKTKVDTLDNYDDTTLQGKVDTVDTVVDAIKTKVDTLDNTDLTTTNSKIDGVKAVVDTIQNYDDTTLIGKIDVIDANVDAILVDTDELQTNQGNWATATGFATPTNVTDAQLAIVSEVNANETKIDTIDTVVDAIKSKVDTLQNPDLSTLALEATSQELKTNMSKLNNNVIDFASIGIPDGERI